MLKSGGIAPHPYGVISPPPKENNGTVPLYCDEEQHNIEIEKAQYIIDNYQSDVVDFIIKHKLSKILVYDDQIKRGKNDAAAKDREQAEQAEKTPVVNAREVQNREKMENEFESETDRDRNGTLTLNRTDVEGDKQCRLPFARTHKSPFSQG